MGVEPTSSPWKGDIIAVIRHPHVTAMKHLADHFGVVGFAPTISCSQSMRLRLLGYTPN
jgi:hypothetical protein